jgi:hypothetical protein
VTKTKTKTTTTLVDDPVAAARSVVDQMNQQEVRLALMILRKSTELSGVKAARGDAVLDADDPDGAARESGRQVAALKEELDALAAAAVQARGRRIAALPGLFATEAAALEAKATAMEADAAAKKAESDRLLAAVEEFNDWGFVPAQARVDGQYVAVVMRSTEYRVVDARGPVYQRLLGDAQALRTQAAHHRFKVAHRAGAVGADSIEDVISVVHSDAMRIGPSAADIIAFVESHTAGAVNTTDPLRIHLVWDGIIDPAQSRVAQGTATHAHVPAGGGDGQTIDSILGVPVGAE